LFPFSVRAAKASPEAELAAAFDLASSARKPHVPKGLSSTHFPHYLEFEPKVLDNKRIASSEKVEYSFSLVDEFVFDLCRNNG